MRRYFTRALGLALAFILALALLPGAALAAASAEVWAGGVKVSATPGGYWKTEGGSLLDCNQAEIDAGTWNVHYETATASNATLTLKGAQITGAHVVQKFKCGIYTDGDLTLRLLGDSAVGGPILDYPESDTISSGVYVEGKLTIMGDGALASTGGKGAFSYGVIAEDLHMRSGTLAAVAGAADGQSVGVMVSGTAGNNVFTMDGGRLTGKGGPVSGIFQFQQTTPMAVSLGIYAPNIIMRGGDMAGTGGKAEPTGPAGISSSNGVQSIADIILEGGTLAGTGGPSGNISYGVTGVFPDAKLTVRGGEVTAQSLDASPTAQAFEKAPAIDPAYADCWVWYGADAEAAWRQGPRDKSELATRYTEKYAYIGQDGPPAPQTAAASSGPNYRYRTLRDGATGIEVSGYFSEDAALLVKEATLHPAGACAACDAIRARQAAGELVLLWDVSLATGGYSGGFEMRFSVGAKYNGQTVTLLHCRANMLESQSALVENGMAQGMFGGFSPFAVAAGGGAAGIPKTGDGPALWLGLALVALAVGAYGLARRRKA